jgi:hypothetical protein
MPVSKKRDKKKRPSIVQKKRKAAEARQVRKNIKELQDMINELENMDR